MHDPERLLDVLAFTSPRSVTHAMRTLYALDALARGASPDATRCRVAAAFGVHRTTAMRIVQVAVEIRDADGADAPTPQCSPTTSSTL